MTETIAPEFSRIIDANDVPNNGILVATPAERAALAVRFDLPSIDALKAEYTVQAQGKDVRARGKIMADFAQNCVISGKLFANAIDVPFEILFANVDAAQLPAELELSPEECDVMALENGRFDLGEAVAQSFALALDPYPRGPDADKIARAKGLKSEEESGPFGALAALRDQLER